MVKRNLCVNEKSYLFTGSAKGGKATYRARPRSGHMTLARPFKAETRATRPQAVASATGEWAIQSSLTHGFATRVNALAREQ
jgi:hypothetical protein